MPGDYEVYAATSQDAQQRVEWWFQDYEGREHGPFHSVELAAEYAEQQRAADEAAEALKEQNRRYKRFDHY